MSEGLRSALQSKSAWTRSRNSEIISRRIKYLTIVLAFTIYAEVFIGLAQVFENYYFWFSTLAIFIPLLVVGFYFIIYWLADKAR